ncbi:MAG: class I SAM-dependent methyltransferase [Actinomycetota bacterium]|nr:class I SAM-dependent methyltransferase [Actinomycetota bacterium]
MARRVLAADPYAHLKDGAWRELAVIDGRLERGEIDEEGWHREVQELLVPAYLAADTPWGQSGKSGDAEDWRYARSHIAHAIDRAGAFLDVGCANGFLMESITSWAPFSVEPYGLDLSPQLVELARRRLPRWADRIFVGNALHWEPPRCFDFVRTGLEYVPRRRRRELVEHLLSFCDRLIVGVFPEHESERTTEELLRGWGFRIAGRSERANRRKPGMEYRVLWIDAAAAHANHPARPAELPG